MTEKVYIGDVKTLLFIGTLLVILSMLPGIGNLLSLIGWLIYMYGLYRWKELVDERPFKLGFAIFMLSLFQVIFVLALLDDSPWDHELFKANLYLLHPKLSLRCDGPRSEEAYA